MTITYQHEERSVPLTDANATILQVSVDNKIPHFRECGGQGRCTTCRVRILNGIQHVSDRSPREANIARERGWDDYTRLACQTRVHGDVCLERLIKSPADVSLVQAEVLRSSPGRELPVAILVCDIREFTPLADHNLPHDVFHILNRFFGELGEPILLNGGMIYQYVGDQIVGLFGIQGADPAQSCENAVRAGMGMIQALDDLNAVITEEFDLSLDIRIGAHFGTLVVGYLGHPSSLQFAVVGDAMNTASRIEGANKDLGTTFLASVDLLDHLALPIVEGLRDQRTLRGKRGPLTLVEVLGFATPDPGLLVQRTARTLLADQERFAETFYRRLFEVAPQVRRMFTTDLKAQGRMLTQLLEVAVYGLSRFDEVAPGLATLGRNHVRYGVTHEHYVVFFQVMLDTVHEILGGRFTPEVEAAWRAVLHRIVEAMHGRSGKAERFRQSPVSSETAVLSHA